TESLAYFWVRFEGDPTPFEPDHHSDRHVLAGLERRRIAFEADPEVGERLGLVLAPDEASVVDLGLRIDRERQRRGLGHRRAVLRLGELSAWMVPGAPSDRPARRPARPRRNVPSGAGQPSRRSGSVQVQSVFATRQPSGVRTRWTYSRYIAESTRAVAIESWISSTTIDRRRRSGSVSRPSPSAVQPIIKAAVTARRRGGRSPWLT